MGVPRPVWGVGDNGGRVLRAAGRRGCWGDVWRGEADEAKAAMMTTGLTGCGPGQCTLAERGRYRRPHASPGPVQVKKRRRPRRDRPISPGRVAKGSNGRGGGGAGSAKQGVGCWLLEPRNACSAATVGWRFGGGGWRYDSPATRVSRGGRGVPVGAVPCRGRGAWCNGSTTIDVKKCIEYQERDSKGMESLQ